MDSRPSARGGRGARAADLGVMACLAQERERFEASAQQMLRLELAREQGGQPARSPSRARVLGEPTQVGFVLC